MKKIIVLSILLLFFVFFRAPVFASSISINPSQDTYVATTHANSNLSNSTISEEFYNADQNQSFILLKFPLNGIPQNAQVSAAMLKLYMSAAGGDSSIPMMVRVARSDWANNVNWFTKPDLGEGYATTNVSDVLGFKTWNVTQLVQGWKSGAIPNNGIYIAFTVDQRDAFRRTFNMLEAPLQERRPVLTVEYTVPAAQNAGVNINFRITPIVIKITPFVQNAGNVAGGSAALTISDVVSQADFSTATVTWKTNKNSSTYVYYGNAQDGVNRFDKQAGQNDSVTNHSVSINGLTPNNKYSFKTASVDATANTTYAPIAYFSTLNEASAGAYDNIQSPTPTPSEADQNPISEIKNGVENKVAEYVIQQSTPSSQTASSDAGQNTKTLSSGNPVVLIAGWAGTNRVAGVAMIILGILSFVGAFIIFETGRRVHGHIKRRLKKGKKKNR